MTMDAVAQSPGDTQAPAPAGAVEQPGRERLAVRSRPASPYIPICKDFDAECVEVRCFVTCWLHAPERGRCPYLEMQPPR
jgi:hypothetical protein